MGETHAARAVVPGIIFVIEDDAAVRDSLLLLLRVHGFQVHGFESAEEFLASGLGQQHPSCALVDIRLPGMSGLALQARILHEGRGPPVLLMTAQGDAEIARTALLQGAVDFLEKPIEEAHLLEAVSDALRDDATHALRHQEHKAIVARLAALTRHERELFESITNGRQSRDIALEFGIPIAVVDAQRSKLMEKLQARRLADLFRLRFRVAELVAANRPPG